MIFFQSYIFRECKSYSDNPLCDYIDNDGKEGFGQGTDIRCGKNRAGTLGNTFVGHFESLYWDLHLLASKTNLVDKWDDKNVRRLI